MDSQMEQEPLKSEMATCQMSIQRQVFTNNALAQAYGREVHPKEPFCSRVRNQASKTCSRQSVLQFFLTTFPIINTLRTYKFREYLIPDVIAGLTVGVMHIPQGLGFALLASLPPIYGIYSSFFPAIIYVLFGTAPHVSMGTMAVISLMLATAVNRESEIAAATILPSDTIVTTDPPGESLFGYAENDALFNSSLIISYEGGTGQNTVDLDAIKVSIAAAVTLLAGIIQIGMSFLRLGVITTLMSTAFVCGFTTGAAAHIVTSQLRFFLGISVSRHEGILKLPKTIISIFANITQTNIAELITAVICLTLLILIKEIINERFKKYLKFPIPAELILVVLGTVISYFAKLSDRFDVRVVGTIQRGIPAPSVPPMNHAGNVIVEAILIAIVGFVISYSMADMFSRKHSYEVDTNQELFAIGAINTISSFFSCFAGCAAPPRCAVVDSVGGKTTLLGIPTAVLLLLVMLAIGPWFQQLPSCVLAAIIVVALFPMFKQLKQLPNFWRINRYDAAVWIVTMTAVIILDVDIGVGIGIGFSIITIILQAALTDGITLGPAEDSDLYLPSKTFEVKQLPRVKVFKFLGSLYFITRERFKKELFKATINPRHVKKFSSQDKGEMKEIIISTENNNPNEDEHDETTKNSNQVLNDHDDDHTKKQPLTAQMHNTQQDFDTIILDCSAMSYLDMMGVNTIKLVYNEFQRIGITIALAQCNQNILSRLEAADIASLHIGIYPTVHDAVLALEMSSNLKKNESNA